MATQLPATKGTRLSPCRFFHRLPRWWSRVLFPAQVGSSNAGRGVRTGEVILVLGAFLLLFSRLDTPLQEPEETLYAEIPRQMLAEGRWLVPVRHGQAYYDKPPLLYWLVMGVYRVTGIHDWAARLVPCSAAFLSVLLTYWWGKRTVGPRAAFAGAVMLCLSPRFAQMARMVTTNGLLTLWVIAALATAHQALAGPVFNRRWWLMSALACGLGVLTKGPVALALVLVPLILYQFLDRRGARAGFSTWTAYLGVVGAVGLPWFVIVISADTTFVEYFFWTHHIRRFFDPIDHLQPVWYYLPVLLGGMFPWTLLLPGFVKYLVRRAPEWRGQRNGALGLFVLAGLWGLVFFSASGCKRPSYILPAMPPLALALGCFVDAAASLGRLRLKYWAWSAAACFLILFLAAQCLLPDYAGRFSVRAQVFPHREACARAMPVMSFPHGWDGVNFYLQRSDIRIFRPRQLPDMISALTGENQSLVVVKSAVFLKSFLAGLPASMEFVPCTLGETITVGWVRKRAAWASAGK